VTRARAVAGALVAIVVIAIATAFGIQYERAGHRLARHRAEARAAATELAVQNATLQQERDSSGLTERAVAATRAATTHAADARTWMAGVMTGTQNEVDTTQSAIAEAETARYLVTANANETRACIDGVSRAVNANKAGDNGSAVAALRGADDACTRTLALSTGARFPYDFPDPFVMRAGGAYYAYSTNSGAGDVQVIRSTDLVTWELAGNALPVLPRWARPGTTWAPAVLARSNSYVLYYTTRDIATNRQCIARAVSAKPAGPFLDDSAGPIVCDAGGSIDPSPFVDSDGRAFLLWKSEGFPPGGPTMLWSQELTADGLAVQGSPRQLLAADRSFERGIVEAPSLLQDNGQYFLIYAAANWTSQTYSIAFATCAGPSGPCTKPANNRVLTSGSKLAGPGGAEAFRDANGSLMVAFHAFTEPNVGYPSSRYLHIAPLRAGNGDLVIDART
jgi:hypothetical protein